MNGTTPALRAGASVTQVRNRRASHMVEIHYQDEQGQSATIALTPEKIIELHLASEQAAAERRKWLEDLHYGYQNAKLLDELLDYLDIISEVDFDEWFKDDPEEYKADWKRWLDTYGEQRRARKHFFIRKGEQS